MEPTWIDEHKKMFICGLFALIFIVFALIIVLILVNWMILVVLGLVALFLGIPLVFQKYFKKLYYYSKHRKYYPNKGEINPLIRKYQLLVAVIIVEAFTNPPIIYFAFKWGIELEVTSNFGWLTQFGDEIVGMAITLITVIPFLIGTLLFKLIDRKYNYVGEMRIENRLKDILKDLPHPDSQIPNYTSDDHAY